MKKNTILPVILRVFLIFASSSLCTLNAKTMTTQPETKNSKSSAPENTKNQTPQKNNTHDPAPNNKTQNNKTQNDKTQNTKNNDIKNQPSKTSKSKKKKAESEPVVPLNPLEEINANPNILKADEIVVIIFTTEGEKIITLSDITKPSLTGAPRSLDDLIFETLVYFDAKKMKAADVDDDAINRYFALIQKENDITAQELENIFTASGYTMEQVREQFKIMQAVNGMLDFKIRSNLIVPRSSIEKYYAENPVFSPKKYQLQYVSIPYITTAGPSDNLALDTPFNFDEPQTAQIKNSMFDVEKNNQKNNILANLDTLNWGEPFWINESDIEPSKLELIIPLNSGETSTLQENSTGFEMYKLITQEESKLVPLEERVLEIMDQLRAPRYTQLLAEYKKTLYDNASIVYL